MSAPLNGAMVHSGWTYSRLLKIAGVAEFASGDYPMDQMVLDLRGNPTWAASPALRALPWAGFLSDKPESPLAGRPYLVPSIALCTGDVIEIFPDTDKLSIRYRRGANGNILFTTERCNSYCVMCSQPPRDVDDAWRVQYLLDLINLIDRDAPLLTITGGEPTLLGDGLACLIQHCAAILPNTALQVLSNGRNFASAGLADTFKGLHPNLIWCVPLYADHFALHDYVVQSIGAFAETVRGLYALEAAQQRIEIRVVLVKPVVERLPELARYIFQNFPFVEHVAWMGTEPAGFAKGHYNDLWMDPVDMAPALTTSIHHLQKRGIKTSIYNLPLCTVPAPIRFNARRSISDWKQNLLPACAPCALKSECAGFFAWTTPKWTSRAIAPIEHKEETCGNH